MADEKEKVSKLSARKRASIWILLLVLKIIAPMEYSHQYDAELKEVKVAIKNI